MRGGSLLNEILYTSTSFEYIHEYINIYIKEILNLAPLWSCMHNDINYSKVRLKVFNIIVWSDWSVLKLASQCPFFSLLLPNSPTRPTCWSEICMHTYVHIPSSLLIINTTIYIYIIFQLITCISTYSVPLIMSYIPCIIIIH